MNNVFSWNKYFSIKKKYERIERANKNIFHHEMGFDCKPFIHVPK